MMKILFSSLLAFMLGCTAWAAAPQETLQTAMPEATLNTAAHYLDNVFVNSLNSLNLTAMTAEAKSGDWKGIKRYLNKLRRVALAYPLMACHQSPAA